MQNEKADMGACPWDPERLAMITSSPAEEQGIVLMLLQQGKQVLAAMEQYIEDEQVLEWRKAAHTLRGSAANLGMKQLASFCKENENSTATRGARAQLMENIRAELQRIEHYKA